MSLFDMFTTKPQQQPAPQQAPQQQPGVGDPGNIPAPSATNAPVADPAPAPAPGSATPNAADNPLAPFADLWKNEPKPEGQDAPVGMQLTQEAVQKIVAKTDFSSVVSPDMLAQVANGGEEAQQAFAQAMNQVAQHVMVQSTMVNNKLAERQINDAIQAQLAKLPQTLRQQAATDHLKSTNPLFSNPAVQPVIEATHAQLLQKYPNATNAEITQMTHDYVLAMGKQFAPQPQVNDSGAGETDWDAFLQAQ